LEEALEGPAMTHGNSGEPSIPGWEGPFLLVFSLELRFGSSTPMFFFSNL